MDNLHEALHEFLGSSRVYQTKHESERKMFGGSLLEKIKHNLCAQYASSLRLMIFDISI
jgi:hypothetical protein